MENILETTIKGLGFRAIGSPYDGESKGNMENEMETVVIWGFTEPNLSHCIGKTLLFTNLYPLWQLNLSSLTAKPVILEAGFSSLFSMGKDTCQCEFWGWRFLRHVIFLYFFLLLIILPPMTCKGPWRLRSVLVVSMFFSIIPI